MSNSVLRLYTLISLSVMLGLLVSIYPLSPAFNSLRPELLCLLVIYWVTNLPLRLGIFFSASVGLMQDLVEGVVWGAHAAGLAMVAYVCIRAYQRIKNYSVWHQALWIFVFVGIHQIIVNWFQGLAGYRQPPLDLLISTAISALFWPLLHFGFNRIVLRLR